MVSTPLPRPQYYYGRAPRPRRAREVDRGEQSYRAHPTTGDRGPARKRYRRTLIVSLQVPCKINFRGTLFGGVTPYFRRRCVFGWADARRSRFSPLADGCSPNFRPPSPSKIPLFVRLYFFLLSTTCLLSRPRPRIPMPFLRARASRCRRLRTSRTGRIF